MKKNIYEKAKELLRTAYDKNDPDAKAVIDGGFEESFCQFFDDVYSWEEFCTWLVEHDLDICCDFRFADIREWDDIIDDVDRYHEDTGGVYNLNVEGWDNLTKEEKIERIKESSDCLLVGDLGLCVSW